MIQHSYNKNSVCIIFVPSVGLEPTRLTTYAPKAYVATNYTMKAFFVEQIPGIEPGFHPYQGCIITNYMITAFVLREGLEPSRHTGHCRLKTTCLPFHHRSICWGCGLRSHYLQYVTLTLSRLS